MKWIVVLMALLLGGCSMASLKESYKRTPQEAEAVGEGWTEIYRLVETDGGWVLVPLEVQP